MKSTFKDILNNTKKIIFENNFTWLKKELPAEKDTIFYLYVT